MPMISNIGKLDYVLSKDIIDYSRGFESYWCLNLHLDYINPFTHSHQEKVEATIYRPDGRNTVPNLEYDFMVYEEDTHAIPAIARDIAHYLARLKSIFVIVTYKPSYPLCIFFTLTLAKDEDKMIVYLSDYVKNLANLMNGRIKKFASDNYFGIPVRNREVVNAGKVVRQIWISPEDAERLTLGASKRTEMLVCWRPFGGVMHPHNGYMPRAIEIVTTGDIEVVTEDIRQNEEFFQQ